MLRVIFIVVVALFGSLALGLAWLSRNERAGMIVFGTAGLACWALVLTAISVRAPWVTWTLTTVAIVGLIIVAWALLTVTAIVKHFDAMYVRQAELGQAFQMSSAARVFRVGELRLRFSKIETSGPGDQAVSLTAEFSDTRSSLVLRKRSAAEGSSAVVGGYRVRLVDVTMTGSQKTAMPAARLMVTTVDPP